MQTAAEFLVQHFGESAKQIANFDCWGAQTISGASFTLFEGRMNTMCHGQCIITLHRSQTIDKRPMYICYDDSARGTWEARRRQLEEKYKAGGEINDALTKDEWSDWHSSCPSPRLVLSQSA